MFHFLLTALIALLLAGANAGEIKIKEKINAADGQWEVGNTASRRFATPLGALYRFQPRYQYRPATLLDYSGSNGELFDTGSHGLNCNCDYCRARYSMSSVLCQIPQNMAKNRYLMCEFSLRNFPGFSPDRNYINCFTIGFSNQSGTSYDYDTLQSVLRVNWANSYYYSRYQANPLQPDPQALFFATGEPYMPPFEPLNIRLIFDTRPRGLVYLIVNGERRYIGKHEEKSPKNPPKIRSLSILIEKSNPAAPDVDVFWEISDPKITSFDQDETLLALLDGKYKPYPTELFDRERKLASSKNPDYLYRSAVKLLYGSAENAPAPEKGIETLRRAATDNHVPALYLLGLCYFRGLGVESNPEQALKYLETARQYGSPDAGVLSALIEYRRRRLTFIWPDEVKTAIARPLAGPGHDYGQWTDIFGYRGPMPLEYSFRSTLRGAFDCAGDNIQAIRRKPDDNLRAAYLNSLRPALARSVFPEKLPVRLKTGPNEDHYSGFDFELAEEAVKANYAPAQYALAIALDFSGLDGSERARLQTDERIDSLLKQAAARNFSHAVLAQIRRKLLRREDPRSLITPQIAFEFADEPWFLALVFAMENPGFPGVDELLIHRLDSAQTILARQKESPATRYFAGLLALMHPYGPQMSLYQRSRLEGNPYQARTFELFTPMQEGNVHAQYMVGKFLLENPRELPSVGISRDSAFQSDAAAFLARGPQLLRKAGQAGHLKALYLLALHEKNQLEALRLLELPCHYNIADAWLLRARILERFRPGVETVRAYEQCAALGVPEGLAFLARNASDPEKKRRYDLEFLRLDLRLRSNDIFDFYDSRHFLKQQWISSDLLNVPDHWSPQATP